MPEKDCSERLLDLVENVHGSDCTTDYLTGTRNSVSPHEYVRRDSIGKRCGPVSHRRSGCPTNVAHCRRRLDFMKMPVLAEASKMVGNQRWCPGEDSNLHTLAGAST